MDSYYFYIQELNIQQQKKELIAQLKKNGIKNEQVIEAISKVPREEFIPQNLKKYATN